MGFLSRSKDGTPDNANALRFEDRAGEEQVWIPADRNMDTNIKNDETHAVGGNQTVNIGKDHVSKVEGSYAQMTQATRSELVGGDYELSVEGTLTLASASAIRLICGDSTFIMNEAGDVMLECNTFSINAAAQGEINTGGTLDLNIKKPGGAISVAPMPDQIKERVNAAFNKNKGNS